MNSEIINNGMIEVNNPSVENFRNIIPESRMSSQEVDLFWRSHFHELADQANNKDTVTTEKTNTKEYFDINGTKYRDGDSLLMNKQFEINGYQYTTDEQGRIKSASGKLRIESDYIRNMEKVRYIEGQDYQISDDQSHLIAHQFGGSDKLENLVPMDAKLNRGDYAKLERTLADAVADGADVRLKVEPVYDGDTTRPSEFRVTYSIDGEKDMVVFKNESEANT